MNRLLILLAVLSSSACASMSPHENFKAHIASAVGKQITDSNTWARDDRLEAVAMLENGNLEYSYTFRRSCFYFYEVEKGSDIILAWRFEGSESDCAIAP